MTALLHSQLFQGEDPYDELMVVMMTTTMMTVMMMRMRWRMVMRAFPVIPR